MGVECPSAGNSIMHNRCRKSLCLLCKCGTVNERSPALRKMKQVKDTHGRKREDKTVSELLFKECQYQYVLLNSSYYRTVITVCCCAELHGSARYLLDFVRHQMN